MLCYVKSSIIFKNNQIFTSNNPYLPFQMWIQNDPQQNNAETFSSCLALTEKSLSAHNRINHKHFKQQRKGATRENWFQQKEVSKHNKKSQGQAMPLRVSTLTQTDDKSGGETKEKPGVGNPFMFSSMNGCGTTPTPFFIPGNKNIHLFLLTHIKGNRRKCVMSSSEGSHWIIF